MIESTIMTSTSSVKHCQSLKPSKSAKPLLRFSTNEHPMWGHALVCEQDQAGKFPPHVLSAKLKAKMALPKGTTEKTLVLFKRTQRVARSVPKLSNFVRVKS